MKFRILVKQNPNGLVPVYYPQFRIWGWLWCYYTKSPTEEVLPYCGFFFRADAERFLRDRFDAALKAGQVFKLPWNRYQ